MWLPFLLLALVAGVVDGQAQGYAVGTAVDDSRLRFFERMARQQDYNALAKGQSTLGGAAWQQTMQRGHFERPVRLTTTSWASEQDTTIPEGMVLGRDTEEFAKSRYDFVLKAIHRFQDQAADEKALTQSGINRHKFQSHTVMTKYLGEGFTQHLVDNAGKWAKHHPVDRVIAGRTYRDHDDKLHPTHHKPDGRRNNVMAGVVGARRLLRG